MKVEHTNAILAGLRLLQLHREAGSLPHAIFELLEGDQPLTHGPITNEQIDALCEDLNFGQVFERSTEVPNGWDVQRTCQWEDENERTLAEQCKDPQCAKDHVWSVYQRIPSDGLPNGVQRWVSDHDTEEHAGTAARAYHYGTITNAFTENIAGICTAISHEIGAGRPDAIEARNIAGRDNGWAGFLSSMVAAAQAFNRLDNPELYVSFDWYDIVDEIAEAYIANPEQSSAEWTATINGIFERLRAKDSPAEK